MKEKLLKVGICFLLSLGITTFLYWPLYQKIILNDFKQNIDIKVSRLVLPLNEEIKEILDRKIDLPKDRHELCLKNRNRFYLFHSDSNTPGVPFSFYTDDLNKNDYGKNNKLGAISIKLYYNNNFEKDENYREFEMPKQCIKLETKKLQSYASSTIEYSYVNLNRSQEFNIGEKGKLTIIRAVVGGYFIDTVDSSAYIVARWKFFLLTMVILFLIFFSCAKKVLEWWQKIVHYFKKATLSN